MWFLFVIGISNGLAGVTANGPYYSMTKCFKVREALLETYPKPKIDYEAVCVKSSSKIILK